MAGSKWQRMVRRLIHRLKNGFSPACPWIALLGLDGSGKSTRLTRFSEYAGYGANNPAISPDGRKMAFGLRVKGGEHGNADGMLLFDYDKAPK